MSDEHLCEMANDIGAYFSSEPDREVAVAGIAGHIEHFWEQRMREKIVAYWRAGANDLDPLIIEALQRLEDKIKSTS